MICNFIQYVFICNIGIPPDIDEGPFIPQPKDLMAGDVTVMIGTPVYVVDGFNVIIDCNVLNGTPPITIIWLHNGVADPNRGNATNITVDDYHDGDVFTCRADNVVGFDIANTTIIIGECAKMYLLSCSTVSCG